MQEERRLASDVPLSIDTAALRALSLDVAAYGEALTAALFAEVALRGAWRNDAIARHFILGHFQH